MVGKNSNRKRIFPLMRSGSFKQRNFRASEEFEKNPSRNVRPVTDEEADSKLVYHYISQRKNMNKVEKIKLDGIAKKYYKKYGRAPINPKTGNPIFRISENGEVIYLI